METPSSIFLGVLGKRFKDPYLFAALAVAVASEWAVAVVVASLNDLKIMLRLLQ